MDERQVKEIYRQLKQYFHNKPEMPKFEEQFTEAIQQLATLIENYEQKRTILMETFKSDLRQAIDKFHQEKFQKGVEKIREHTLQSEENWKEVEPRMEALAQIKSIFKSSFVARRKTGS